MPENIVKIQLFLMTRRQLYNFCLLLTYENSPNSNQIFPKYFFINKDRYTSFINFYMLRFKDHRNWNLLFVIEKVFTRFREKSKPFFFLAFEENMNCYLLFERVWKRNRFYDFSTNLSLCLYHLFFALKTALSP